MTKTTTQCRTIGKSPFSITESVGLARFHQAQNWDDNYDRAYTEIHDGCKMSCWMWYVFPQLQGLGHSSMCKTFGINSLDEAREYLDDPVLRDRLIDITNAATVWLSGGKSPVDLFGSIDAIKFQSCMTLFFAASRNKYYRIFFLDALKAGYGGTFCKRTLELLGISETELNKLSARQSVSEL